MKRKLKRRSPVHAFARRMEVTFDGMDLGISRDEVMADLSFGVEPVDESDRLVRKSPPMMGRVS